MIFLNLFLGTLVAAVGFWLIWGTDSPALVGGWALVVAVVLWGKAKSITEIWAWSTLLLGLESFAWPVTLMVQLKGASETIPESEMGNVLSAVVLGLFSSVFWLSFAYGLFGRARRLEEPTSDDLVSTQLTGRTVRQKKSR